ncbi:MAG: PEP-CTERM sorting domain-containing protein [Verrucomicrobiaceae bacterium]|nr:MAG: PEP-CTERM sorting domain-containing protein [Verrucomicrobiaceae bacterium]
MPHPVLFRIVVFLLLGASSYGTLVIGAFNSDRVGFGNVVDGPIAEDLRSLVTGAFPETTFVGTNLLSSAFLDTVDVLLIGAPTLTGVTSLSSEEQLNLLNFVKRGGGAMIFSDNDTHAGVPTSDDAAETFLDPFGVDGAGHLDGPQLAQRVEQHHPVLDGPFGSVTFIATYHAGWFDGLGSNATSLANFDSNGEAAILGIAPGALGEGSGGVVFLSDAHILIDSAEGGYIGEQDNSKLILNSVAYVVPEPSTGLIGLAGLAVFAACRRHRAWRVEG